ncbi:hypothetical protein [Trebonia sp.]|uniref:hypothetical protein n=1 Tax=Trebonia sp. TaxID=2767075 RepID=UPI00260745D6|nr:hypothetical protein [Trebonia sp.]
MANNPSGPDAYSASAGDFRDFGDPGDPGDFGPDAFDDADADDYAAADIKEALGLPDSLPPIRLPSLPELAAQARKAPLPGQLAALAAWIGEDGRAVTDDGDLTRADFAAATSALGVQAADLVFLWEYALAVEWLEFDGAAEDRVMPGETAQSWAADQDETVFDAWSATLAAVLGETLEVTLPEPGLQGLDFQGQPMALAILLFLARREGLSVADFTEILWENSSADLPEREAARARERWVARYGEPARLLLDKLTELAAVRESDDTVRLTPLALAALHEQLVEAGIDIPLLPPTAAELTGAQLLAMAEGVDDDEFEAEADAWVAARGADHGARELLALAAAGGPGERMLAVAAVTRIGAGAGQAWRDNLDVPQLRAYAKAALAGLADGEDVPAGLQPLPADVAWVTTDLLALACDEEYPDPEEIAASLREAVPAGQEAAVFEMMWRAPHPDVLDVLNHIGRYHPDKQVAKAARTAAHKAAGRPAPGGR